MKLFLLFFGLLGFVVQAAAKEKIYVNSEVTTHIVMPENINWWTSPRPGLWATSVPTTWYASSLIWSQTPLKPPLTRMNCWAPSP